MYAATLPATHSPSSPVAQQDSAAYGPNFRILRDMGITQAHTLGFTGRGIRIAILDTGFEPAHQAFTNVTVAAQRDFINNDRVVSNEPSEPVEARDQELHGTWVWSIVGGNRSGQIIGPAFQAEYLLAKVNIEQSGTDPAADEDRWVQAVAWADSLGARLIVSALAFRDLVPARYTADDFNGDVPISSQIADQAARRGILIVTAMGNFGPAPRSLGAPADADSVLAVGAVDTLGIVLPQSARGPTADGRPKPEVVARGINVYAARSTDFAAYEFVSAGTSLSTALVAGGAAQFLQAWPNLSVMAARNAIVLSGTRANLPNDNAHGAGVPNIASAIAFPEGILPAGVATVDLAGVLTTIAPTFNWSVPLVLSGARPLYRLELATNPTFTNIVYTDTITNAFSLTVRRPIQPAATLYWRVTGEVFPGIRRSSPVSGPLRMPDWVMLTVLNDVRPSIVNTTRPTLRWQPLLAPPPAGPLTYDVEVFSDAGPLVQRVRNLSTASLTLPEPLQANLSYRWRVIARSPLGVADTVESIGVFLVTSAANPPATLLYAPFPNPFPRADRTETRLWFDISEDSAFVELAILDMRGRLIKQLIPSQPQCGAIRLDSGQFGRGALESDPCQLTRWDGTDLRGEQVPFGVYIARLRVNGRSFTQRILFSPRE